MNFSRHIYAVAGLAILITAVSMGTPTILKAAPAAPTSNVLVVNPVANPVPTAAQGTTQVGGSVSITGTPSVSLSGTPTVSISGTPTVGLSAGTQVAISGTPAVTISGTPTVGLSYSNANPLPVKTPARTLFTATCQLSVPNSVAGTTGVLTPAVPDGKILVVDFINVAITTPVGQGVAFANIQPSDIDIPVVIPMTPQSTNFSGNECHVGLFTAPLVLQAGIHLVAFERSGTTGVSTAKFIVQGHLE